MGSRPELIAPPEIYYDDDTARKYTSNSRIIEIQNSMTERALELLALPEDGVPKLLLDIGCGSGLSGETITDNGHHWIGLDISASMLNIALEREVEGDVLLGDMGQGLGLRFGVFDGAIGISTIQWLCNADKSSHNPKLRLKAVFQVYPENDDQRVLILNAAMEAGFRGCLFKDYQGSSKKEKEFLFLTCGQNVPMPKGKTEDDDSEDEENKIVFFSDRHRPRKRQKYNTSEKGREWIKRKKEQMRRRGNDVPRDTKYTGRKSLLILFIICLKVADFSYVYSHFCIASYSSLHGRSCSQFCRVEWSHARDFYLSFFTFHSLCVLGIVVQVIDFTI